jgi:hypothetical protein
MKEKAGVEEMDFEAPHKRAAENNRTSRRRALRCEHLTYTISVDVCLGMCVTGSDEMAMDFTLRHERK